MKKLTIYAVAIDANHTGTECHIFTDIKERDRYLVRNWFHEDAQEEGMRIAMQYGFYSKELKEMHEDEGLRSDPCDTFDTAEIDVPLRFRLTHPTLTIEAEERLITEMLRQGNTVLAANGHPASHTAIEDLLTALIDIGKAEIISDFHDGRQCWDAPDFAALHDNTDANEYALLCDDLWAWTSDSETEEHEQQNEWRVQARNDVANAIQGALNDWLIDTLPLRQAAATQVFVHHPDVQESVGEWTSHPIHERTEWQLDAANGDTQLGYWEWVSNRLRD